MPKKEIYRLQPLVTLKERNKRKAEIALARAMKNFEEEKSQLAKLEGLKMRAVEKRAKAQADMREKVSGGRSLVKDTQSHLGYIMKLKEDEESLAREIKNQEEQVQIAKDKMGRARRDYIDAASELNVMQKHRELWRKKQAAKLSALENKQMGELAQVVYQMNKMR